MCDRSWSVTAAAQAAGISVRTAYRWLVRWRAEGLTRPLPGAQTHSHRTPADRVQAIAVLRRLHMPAAEIAEVLAMALSTVSAVLRRIGLGKRSTTQPLRAKVPLESSCTWISRSSGASVSVAPAIASAAIAQASSRLVPVALAPQAGSSSTWPSTTPRAWPMPRCFKDERAATAAGFLRRAVAWFGSFGVTV